MISSFALFIDVPDAASRTQAQIQTSLEKIGLPLFVCATWPAALETINEQAAAGMPPTLILLSSLLENPAGLARQLHREVPLAHFAFLTNGINAPLLQQLKSPVAMIGTFWSLIDLESVNFPDLLQSAASAAWQRLQHHTTLNHINSQLASQPKADISELQRCIISHRFLANILEHAQDGIITTNNDGTIITWNSAAERMFGLSEDEAVGRSLIEVAAGEWADQLPLLINQLHTSASAYSRQELIYQSPDGRTLTIELMLSLVRDEPGQPLGMSAVVRDITERKAFEKRIQEAQKMESLGILAGGVAHDFNNILTGVLMNVELALLKLPPDSPTRTHLETAQKSTSLAAALSAQMLAYSGKGHLVIQPVNLSRLVDEMAPLLHKTISKTAVIHYHLARSLPSINGDLSQLRQVITNLITNASEAIGSESGRITVTTGVEDCDAQYLSQTLFNDNLEPGIYIYLEITDTGHGMDKETQSKIFDPFYSTRFTGRGLGLAAVVGIVRGHNGAIQVKSQEGQGTTFKILFPVAM